MFVGIQIATELRQAFHYHWSKSARLCAARTILAGAMSALAMVSLGYAGTANNTIWTATEGEEDWGKACYVSRTLQSGLQITFISSVGGPVSLLVSLDTEDYPAEVQLAWQVDQNPSILMTGTVSDYFIVPAFATDAKLLRQFAAGRQLSIESATFGTYTIDLAGAENAFRSFSACRS